MSSCVKDHRTFLPVAVPAAVEKKLATLKGKPLESKLFA